MARHGRRARRLAQLRSMDAYLLGDLAEQERWGRIREIIEARQEVAGGSDHATGSEP